MTIEKRILEFDSKKKGFFNQTQYISATVLCSCGNKCYGVTIVPEYIDADAEIPDTIEIECDKCKEMTYVHFNNYWIAVEFNLDDPRNKKN